MVRALAPRRSRGDSWVLLLLLTLSLGFSTRFSQAQTEAPEAPQAETTPESNPAEEQGAVDTKTGRITELDATYEDPNAQALLENQYPELHRNVRIIQGDERDVLQMAMGQQRIDRDKITNYIQNQAAELTKHSNIQAMLEPDSNPSGVERLSEAGEKLVRPLLEAQAANNEAFRREYSRVLLEKDIAPELLKNHLYARTMTMVALSRVGEEQAIPILIEQIRDPKQPLAVRMLAAIGLTSVARGGRQDVSPTQAIEASRALTEFLEDEQNHWWPSQVRALEALGALRQASSSGSNPQADFSAQVLKYLADPDQSLSVRAWAAWALGMIRPSERNDKYNFQLIAYHAGRAAVEIGDQVLELEPENPELAKRLTNLLLQILVGFYGNSEIRNSGLLNTPHSNLLAQKTTIQPIADRVQKLTAAAIELNRAVGAQKPSRRTTLQSALEDLRTYLSQNPPQNVALIPDGPTFPVPSAPGQQQAKAEAAAPR